MFCFELFDDRYIKGSVPTIGQDVHVLGVVHPWIWTATVNINAWFTTT
jgi:hypothetical protein